MCLHCIQGLLSCIEYIQGILLPLECTVHWGKAATGEYGGYEHKGPGDRQTYQGATDQAQTGPPGTSWNLWWAPELQRLAPDFDCLCAAHIVEITLVSCKPADYKRSRGASRHLRRAEAGGASRSAGLWERGVVFLVSFLTIKDRGLYLPNVGSLTLPTYCGGFTYL